MTAKVKRLTPSKHTARFKNVSLACKAGESLVGRLVYSMSLAHRPGIIVEDFGASPSEANPAKVTRNVLVLYGDGSRKVKPAEWLSDYEAYVEQYTARADQLVSVAEQLKRAAPAIIRAQEIKQLGPSDLGSKPETSQLAPILFFGDR